MKRANDNYRGHRAEIREAERIALSHDIERRIKEENEEFAAMTPAQKRVRIAKDVLEWMKAGKLVATNGQYLELYDDRRRTRGAHRVNGFECHACALGSVFAVAVERGVARPNVGGLRDTWNYDMRDRLEPYFEREQLLAIEAAFESCDWATNEDDPAVSFCSDIPKSTEDKPNGGRKRMERIMRNIIANNGTFIP